MKILDYPIMLLARTLLLALYLIAFIPAALWVCWRGCKPGEFRYLAYLLIGRVSRPLIDWLFGNIGDKNHCFTSYISAKYNLPTKDF